MFDVTIDRRTRSREGFVERKSTFELLKLRPVVDSGGEGYTFLARSALV